MDSKYSKINPLLHQCSSRNYSRAPGISRLLCKGNKGTSQKLQITRRKISRHLRINNAKKNYPSF